MCSSDLYTAHFSLRQRPAFYTAHFLCGSAPLFILTNSCCGSTPASYTAHFSLRQRPAFHNARCSLWQRLRFLYLPILARSEEHTSELQSRETISSAVFCLKKKKKNITFSHLLLKSTQLPYYIHHVTHFSI